jgi:hypothetical protein
MASIINVQQIGSVNGVLTTDGGVSLSLENTNSYLLLPQGSTAGRYENASVGSIRWNTDIDQLEVFDGILWRLFRRVYDYYFIQGNWILSLDCVDDEKSYPGSGIKWFNTSTDPFKTKFSELPTFNSANSGFIEFNGSSTYATTQVTTALNPTSAITQECWFKTSDNTKSQELISLQYGISTNNSYILYISGSSWVGGVNIAGTFTPISHPFSSTPLNNNQWYNFLHTYNTESLFIRATAITQSGSTILEFDPNLNINFDFIEDMTVVGTGIPADTTILSIDFQNKRITLSNPVDDSNESLVIQATLEPHQFLYVNGELVAKFPLTGTIEYLPDNTLLAIGGGFEGPGTNLGISNLLQGSMSVARVGSFYATPTVVINNYNFLKDRYGL